MDLRKRHTRKLGKLLVRGVLACFLQELLAYTANLVIRLGHVDGNANRIAVVGHGTRDGLSYPPRSVRGELVAATILELIDGFHQTQIAFLNQVRHRKTAIDVPLGNGNHKTQVRLNHLGLGIGQIRLSEFHLSRKISLVI